MTYSESVLSCRSPGCRHTSEPRNPMCIDQNSLYHRLHDLDNHHSSRIGHRKSERTLSTPHMKLFLPLSIKAETHHCTTYCANLWSLIDKNRGEESLFIILMELLFLTPSHAMPCQSCKLRSCPKQHCTKKNAISLGAQTLITISVTKFYLCEE